MAKKILRRWITGGRERKVWVRRKRVEAMDERDVSSLLSQNLCIAALTIWD